MKISAAGFLIFTVNIVFADIKSDFELKMKDTVGFEIRLSPFSHLEAEVLGGSVGNRFIEAYSATDPIDLYQLHENNFRFGVLRPSIAAGTLMTMLLIAYPSIEGMEFIRKYGLFFMVPAYILNPEIRLIPIEKLRIYSGYSYDLVHEKRIRPLLSLRAGGIIKLMEKMPLIRGGFERILYRGNKFDNYSVALLF